MIRHQQQELLSTDAWKGEVTHAGGYHLDELAEMDPTETILPLPPPMK